MVKQLNIEGMKNKLVSGNSRSIVIIAAALVVVAGIAVVAVGSMEDIQGISDGNDTEAENNTDEQEITQRVGLSASQIQGDIVDVTVGDVRAEPSSPEISPEDGIRFVNQAGVDIEFTFDREIKTFEIAAGESTIINPESIVYYKVNSVNDSIEFREISARINVQ